MHFVGMIVGVIVLAYAWSWLANDFADRIGWRVNPDEMRRRAQLKAAERDLRGQRLDAKHMAAPGNPPSVTNWDLAAWRIIGYGVCGMAALVVIVAVATH